MNLLVFFAIPLATILISIVLEKLLDSPLLVAMTIFAIGLIGVFGLVGLGIVTNLGTALIGLIAYTLIAFITAYIVRLLREVVNRLSICCKQQSCCNRNTMTTNCGCNEANNNTESLLSTINNNNILGESTPSIDDEASFRLPRKYTKHWN